MGLLDRNDGLFYSGDFKLLLIQLIGVLAVAAWTIVTMTVVFLVIKKFHGLRVTPAEEIGGLDSYEHGLESAYGGFSIDEIHSSYSEPAVTGDVPESKAVPVELVTDKPVASDVKMTKVEILCNESKFEALKNAMNEIGVSGMTVTKVLGCGIQKGQDRYYRGVKIESMDLRPKVQVEIVVAKVPVRQVIDTAKKVLYTGNIGDGKIFVYDVENVVKVRTGEEGYDALQGHDQF